MTASHDNQKTSIVAVLNGSSNYYGIHAQILHLDTLEITEGTRENGALYIKNPTASAYLLCLTLLGKNNLELNIKNHLSNI